MSYHKVTLKDCLSVATKKQKIRLSMITDIDLQKKLAQQWCDKYGYKLWNHIGNNCWDATSIT